MNDAPLERGIISSYESHIYKHILLLLMMLVCIDLVFGIKMRILYPVENWELRDDNKIDEELNYKCKEEIPYKSVYKMNYHDEVLPYRL